MTKSMLRNKRALSPVIATVILISVTIVVAVSVAYWMGSIAGGYTSFEQIELPTTYAKAISSPFTGWNVTIELKNTGSADATIDNFFVNSIPLKDYTCGVRLYVNGQNQTDDISSLSISVTKGGSATLVLQIEQSSSDGFTSGTRIDMKLHTAAGREYPAQVKLP
ncbi:type IV pilin [Candidatus Bathyarchaeota archaeon]|nr:MAG: type IV pilin [Candidatus Bathyarchaeota archaeon]